MNIFCDAFRRALIVSLSFSLVFLMGCHRNTVPQVLDFKRSDVRISDATLTVSPDGQKLLKASATNTGQSGLKNLMIEFTVFDDQGLEFGSMVGRVQELKAGQSCDVTLPVSPSTNGFKLRRIKIEN